MEKGKGVEEIPRATCPELFAQFLYNSDQEVMFVSFMRKVSSSNHGMETENTQKRDLLLFYSMLQGKCQNSTLNYSWIASFHALTASVFTIIISVYAAWCVCTSGYCICLNESCVADTPGELYLKDQIDCSLPASPSSTVCQNKQTQSAEFLFIGLSWVILVALLIILLDLFGREARGKACEPL